ncbi:hypothetical protein AU106_gp170 [Sinorhizobium phage phiM9]|uniref:Transmembrane protein n=1 Tax=Sinorhizobium phage phiM9 TaxID=1636182 RepID=A0A0F6TGU0_9CAUD|nr:hypothetical protein AU106_gp170 [Sinorhizobium phage phiM9]AKE44801.1 hypothetical protein Sm_phiM9_173 [Sinorhizobium phage phiM9]
MRPKKKPFSISSIEDIRLRRVAIVTLVPGCIVMLIIVLLIAAIVDAVEAFWLTAKKYATELVQDIIPRVSSLWKK